MPTHDQKLQKPPPNKFVTKCLNTELWGNLKLGWENAVPLLPRVKEVQELVQEMEPHVSHQDQLDAFKIIKLISRIDSDSGNCDSCVPATSEEIAFGIKGILERLTAHEETCVFITMERIS